MTRKQITRTAAAKSQPVKGAKLPPYTATKSFHDKNWELLLQVGSMWIPTETIRLSDNAVHWGHRSYGTGLAYVVPTFSWQPFAEKGALAVYVGTTRVAEAKGNTVVEHLRPTFVLNGVKVLTADLNTFQPAYVTDGTAVAGPT